MGTSAYLSIFLCIGLCSLAINNDLTILSSNFQDRPSTLFKWKSTDTLPLDPTWKEYIHLVYGSDTNISAINITQIDMIYTLTSVAEFYFHPSKWVYGVFPTFINSVRPIGRVYQDFEWAEVIRMSTKCFVRHNLKLHGHQLYEGKTFSNMSLPCLDPVLLFCHICRLLRLYPTRLPFLTQILTPNHTQP